MPTAIKIGITCFLAVAPVFAAADDASNGLTGSYESATPDAVATPSQNPSLPATSDTGKATPVSADAGPMLTQCLSVSKSVVPVGAGQTVLATTSAQIPHAAALPGYVSYQFTVGSKSGKGTKQTWWTFARAESCQVATAYDNPNGKPDNPARALESCRAYVKVAAKFQMPKLSSMCRDILKMEANGTFWKTAPSSTSGNGFSHCAQARLDAMNECQRKGHSPHESDCEGEYMASVGCGN